MKFEMFGERYGLRYTNLKFKMANYKDVSWVGTFISILANILVVFNQ